MIREKNMQMSSFTILIMLPVVLSCKILDNPVAVMISMENGILTENDLRPLTSNEAPMFFSNSHSNQTATVYCDHCFWCIFSECTTGFH